METHQRLDDAQLSTIIRLAPLVAIDLIIRDPHGNVLLGLRSNQPAKGYYFVPGGRIRKGETLGQAFVRVLNSETGFDALIEQARFLGVYQHMYPDNRFEDPGYGTHYVVLAYQLDLDARPAVALDSQHSKFEWMDEATLRHTDLVHPFTKAYFKP